MKIGIKDSMPKLTEHDDEWEKNAIDTINYLKGIFEDVAIDIQHIGSTAIKRIRAKPIIDIVVGISDFSKLDNILDKLKHNGILLAMDKLDDYKIFAMGNNENGTTHNIHVYIYNSFGWNNQINFRDYMINNTVEAKEYEKLKIKLSEKYDNINDYTRGKIQYFYEICKKAELWKLNKTK
jgi:GrpB-like predicted nucleotidyltransferase (UPF0157 family)